jgi:cobalt-zinc-cadmium efflux system membrane fusion protein
LYEEGQREEDKMKFKMIPVNIGITDLGFVEVSLPIKIAKDVKVVTKGAYTLASEMIKDELGHDD